MTKVCRMEDESEEDTKSGEVKEEAGASGEATLFVAAVAAAVAAAMN